MPHRSRLVSAAVLVLALLAAVVPTALAVPAGVVDARNLGTEAMRRVIVTWHDGIGAVPAAGRGKRLGEAVPGIRSAASVDADTEAWWLPVAHRGRAAVADLHALAGVRGVSTVVPDVHMSVLAVPNDPLYEDDQIDLSGAWGVFPETAWDTTTGAGSTIAIVDTGITVHPEFTGRVLPGYDFVSDARVANDGGGRDADASDPGDWITDAEGSSGYFAGCRPGDSSWHGTHVTGIAAAKGNNGSAIAGMAWDASILPVRVLGKCGGYESDVDAGIRWAAGGTVPGVAANPHPAGVINLSLSGLGTCDAATQAAIDEANHLGATVVAAAGNQARDVSTSTPADCAGVIAVAASNTGASTRASFSNFGYSVTIAAPGTGIWSTYNTGSHGPGSPAVAQLDGTSMAAPHVTGAVALALAVDPTLTPGEIRTLLVETAKQLPDPFTCQCGAGIVDASTLVAAVPSVPDPTPTASPGFTALPSGAPPDIVPPGALFGTPASTSTRDAMVAFPLTFSEPVADLSASDFVITGTASDCFVADTGGFGASTWVTVRGCTDGTVGLTLKPAAVADGGGNHGPTSPVSTGMVTVDRTGPTAGAPATTLRTGVSLGTSGLLRVHLGWTASDGSGVGIHHFELVRSANRGLSWALVSDSLTARGADTTVSGSGTTWFGVAGVDKLGNGGVVAFGPILSPRLVQQSRSPFGWHGTWRTVNSSKYSGGSARYATAHGASATFTFTGRSVALVSRKGPGRGKARIYVGSTLVATVDLGAATALARAVVWQQTWSTSATRAVKVVVLGTRGRPRVDVDAFEVLR